MRGRTNRRHQPRIGDEGSLGHGHCPVDHRLRSTSAVGVGDERQPIAGDTAETGLLLDLAKGTGSQGLPVVELPLGHGPVLVALTAHQQEFDLSVDGAPHCTARRPHSISGCPESSDSVALPIRPTSGQLLESSVGVDCGGAGRLVHTPSPARVQASRSSSSTTSRISWRCWVRGSSRRTSASTRRLRLRLIRSADPM